MSARLRFDIFGRLSIDRTGKIEFFLIETFMEFCSKKFLFLLLTEWQVI